MLAVYRFASLGTPRTTETLITPARNAAGGRSVAAHMSDDSFRKLLAAQRMGVLATVKRDGRPQVSVVTYIYDLGSDLIRISTRDPLAKTRNLRRDPRATLQVTGPDGGSWAAAEGIAQLSAVARDPHDDVVEALVEHYRDARGEHPDWDDFRAAMVRDERLLLQLPVEHVYGWA